MPDWTTYKGIEVPYATPSGEAGLNLKNDLIGLADRAPFKSTSDPTTSDDEDDGFFAGSQWLNTTSQVMWICVDPTAGSAVWRSLYLRASDAIVLCPGTTTGERGLQHGTGGNTRGTDAVDLQCSRNASDQVASGPNSFIAGGVGNTASGYYAHAEGLSTNATGNSAHSEGYGTTASDYAHAEGWRTNASGNSAHSEGATTQADGYAAHAEGIAALASGRGSHAEGIYTIASAVGSHSGGCYSNAHLLGQIAQASGAHGSPGEKGTAQATFTHLLRRTTSGSSTELTLDGSSPSSGNRLSIVAGQTLSCLVNIVGRKESGGTNDHASFFRQVCIRRTSTTTQLVGSVQTMGTDINPASWGGVTISADDTNDSLKIEVAGAASTNIRWMATVFASEVADAAI